MRLYLKNPLIDSIECTTADELAMVLAALTRLDQAAMPRVACPPARLPPGTVPDVQPSAPTPKRQPQSTNSQLKRRAEAMLQEAGQPMRIAVLVARLREEWPQLSWIRQALRKALITDMDTFQRPAPGYLALTAWGDTPVEPRLTLADHLAAMLETSATPLGPSAFQGHLASRGLEVKLSTIDCTLTRDARFVRVAYGAWDLATRQPPPASLSPAEQQAQAVTAWLAKRGGASTLRELTSYKVAGCQTKAAMVALVERLTEAGQVIRTIQRPPRGGHPTIRIALPPRAAPATNGQATCVPASPAPAPVAVPSVEDADLALLAQLRQRKHQVKMPVHIRGAIATLWQIATGHGIGLHPAQRQMVQRLAAQYLPAPGEGDA